jgi:hypothetical protein
VQALWSKGRTFEEAREGAMSETTTGSAVDVAAAPSRELRRLEPLVGRWTVKGYAQESLAGPAGPVRSRESFEWLDGGYFLVHRYETHFGEQPVQCRRHVLGLRRRKTRLPPSLLQQ